ncbi:hypothetical protein ACIA98_43885 [Streptomyces sp. NPDC051366]|uniref:hypothetical protein n=1 Tax=Streptomyces sp. NPDC051366 TaxID=3365652 RepID=UPI003799B981
MGTAAATAAIVSASGAHADDGGLLGSVNGILNGPALIHVCYPNVQNGYANSNGNQNSNCTQSATQSTPASTTPVQREIVTVGPVTILPGNVAGPNVQCPAGMEAVSGGARSAGLFESDDPRITESFPSGTFWNTTVLNEGSEPINVTFYAVCETRA